MPTARRVPVAPLLTELRIAQAVTRVLERSQCINGVVAPMLIEVELPFPHGSVGMPRVVICERPRCSAFSFASRRAALSI